MPQNLQSKRTHDLWGPEVRHTERELDPESSEGGLNPTRHRIITEGYLTLILGFSPYPFMQSALGFPVAWLGPRPWPRPPSVRTLGWWGGPHLWAPRCWRGQAGASWGRSYHWDPKEAWFSPWFQAHLYEHTDLERYIKLWTEEQV